MSLCDQFQQTMCNFFEKNDMLETMKDFIVEINQSSTNPTTKDDEINKTKYIKNGLLLSHSILELIYNLTKIVVGSTDVPEEFIQITQPNSQIREQIEKFVHWKRNQINQSNLVEFFNNNNNENQKYSSSRTDILKINRASQIKTAVVHNWEGPLARSTANYSDATKLNGDGEEDNKKIPKNDYQSITYHLTRTIPDKTTTTEDDANDIERQKEWYIGERLRPIENHLKIIQQKSNASLLNRIKAIEDKIIHIEQDHPFLAYYHLNYQATNSDENDGECDEDSHIPRHQVKQPKSFKRKSDQSSEQLSSTSLNTSLAKISKKSQDITTTDHGKSIIGDALYDKLTKMRHKIIGNKKD